MHDPTISFQNVNVNVYKLLKIFIQEYTEEFLLKNQIFRLIIFQRMYIYICTPKQFIIVVEYTLDEFACTFSRVANV